jgi:hypothetical protein
MNDLKFKIDKTEYIVRDLTIQDYYDLKISNALDLDTVESKINIISRLSNCPIEELRSIDLTELNLLFSLLNTVMDKNKEVVLTFHHKGKQYGLAHIDEITTGEFIDLDLLDHDPNKEFKLHEYAAILYRPVVGRLYDHYVIEKYNSNVSKIIAEEFKSLPLHYIIGAAIFFLNINKICINNSLDYSKSLIMIPEAKKLIEEMQYKINYMLLEVGGI